MKIGVNGAGRIGRLFIKAALGQLNRVKEDLNRNKTLDVVHINEVNGKVFDVVHLLKYDSTQGPIPDNISVLGDGSISFGGKHISFSQFSMPGEIPWAKYGVDLVIECSGNNLTPEALEGHLQQGAKKVLVSAPIKSKKILNLVYGVNHTQYERRHHNIVTASSCTTNCIAPAIMVLQEKFGIQRGQITTIHNPTNTNLVVDAIHKDPRRARSALMNLIPTTTGSARIIGSIFPELAGKLDGHAVRVPTLNSSLTDCVFSLKKKVSVDEVNNELRQYSKGSLKGILGVESAPLVSSDFLGDSRSCIVDLPSTLVTDNRLLKLYLWYDNEAGYACRLADLAFHMMKKVRRK